MIARRSESREPLLTERERRVLGQRARAFGVKRIAFDLGLSLATVSRALASGAKKLGSSSTSDLCRFSTSMDAVVGRDETVEGFSCPALAARHRVR